MKITVETTVKAPIAKVWDAYVTPDDIQQWNAASDDWHTTQSTVDLRDGGHFSSRMEAKDGSFRVRFCRHLHPHHSAQAYRIFARRSRLCRRIHNRKHWCDGAFNV